MQHRHGVGRRRGLEADAEEHHLPVGVVGGDPGGVQRGVDDPDVAPAGPHTEQVMLAARHPQHVAERAEDDVIAGGDLQRPVDHLQRRDAYRAAGAVDELHRTLE